MVAMVHQVRAPIISLAAATESPRATTARECRQSDSRENSPEPFHGRVSSLPEPHGGESLTARERQQVASLKAVLGRYYPTWKREDETVDDYLERYENSPETDRLKALVKDRVRDDGDWRGFLRDVERNMPGDVLVRDGRPPFGVIPSYQLVIQAPPVHAAFWPWSGVSVT